MIKIFSSGLLLGLILSGLAAFLLPVTDLHREASLLFVKPNGGVVESFSIRIPDDQVIASPSANFDITPGNLKWPQVLADAGLQLQVFKLRNEQDVVVGVASRVVGSVAHESGAAIPAVEWVLHLPARGSLYFPMSGESASDNALLGQLRAGTREFVGMSGSLTETFVPAAGGSGTIALQTTVIANTLPADAGEGE